MIKLINPKETYEVDYNGEAVFTLRRLTTDEVNKINDAVVVSRGEDSFAYLGGTAAKMKLQKALISWKGIADANSNDVPCNDDNKSLLPADVHQFIVDRIDIDNGFKKAKAGDVIEKN